MMVSTISPNNQNLKPKRRKNRRRNKSKRSSSHTKSYLDQISEDENSSFVYRFEVLDSKNVTENSSENQLVRIFYLCLNSFFIPQIQR